MNDPASRPSSHRLRTAMQLRGIGSGAELARLTRQNEVTVRSHVNGTRDVSKKAAEAYSRVLRIDPTWLIYGQGRIARDVGIAGSVDDGAVPGVVSPAADAVADFDNTELPSNARLSASEAPDFHILSKDVPVLGSAECGGDGAFTLNTGEPIDFVRRPPGQMSRRGIYCIYAEGSSMEPVYEAGDLIYVDPHRPPWPGRDVVIQLRAPGSSGNQDGEMRCFLKRLVKRTGTQWRVKQFNPEKEIVLDDRDVAAIHLVLKNHELMGL
jgi:phage repressor protein C with HTH and peptisase S24 domain